MMKYSKTYEPALPRSPLKTIPVQTESESSLLQNSATQDYSSNLFACRQHAHKRHSVYPVHSKISNFESSAFDKDTFLIAHLLVFARAMTVISIALASNAPVAPMSVMLATAMVFAGAPEPKLLGRSFCPKMSTPKFPGKHS